MAEARIGSRRPTRLSKAGNSILSANISAPSDSNFGNRKFSVDRGSARHSSICNNTFYFCSSWAVIYWHSRLLRTHTQQNSVVFRKPLLFLTNPCDDGVKGRSHRSRLSAQHPPQRGCGAPNRKLTSQFPEPVI